MKIKRLGVFFLIILILGIIAYYKTDIQGNAIIGYELENARVLRIIDGDTIEVNLSGNKETIRLLGMDTPERGEGLYLEAKEFLEVIENQTVGLLRDWDDEGKYYRKLRYVFYEGKNLNIEIVERGLAEVHYEDGLVYKDELFRAEKLAKDLEVGIWNPEYVK